MKIKTLFLYCVCFLFQKRSVYFRCLPVEKMLIFTWVAKLLCPSSGSANLIMQVKEPLPEKRGFRKILFQPSSLSPVFTAAAEHGPILVTQCHGQTGSPAQFECLAPNCLPLISPCPWVCSVNIKYLVLSIKSTIEHTNFALQSIYKRENVSLPLWERAERGR